MVAVAPPPVPLCKSGLLLLLYSYLAVLDAVSSFTASSLATPLSPHHHRRRPTLAVLLSISGLLLLYSAAVVPFQICMWDYSDPCNTFPTLRFDVCVDTFFMVLYHTQRFYRRDDSCESPPPPVGNSRWRASSPSPNTTRTGRRCEMLADAALHHFISSVYVILYIYIYEV
jgi:hypothetical protein